MCAGLTTTKAVAIVIIVAIIVAAGTYELSSSRITPSGATTTVTMGGSSTSSPSVPNGGTIVMEETATPDTIDPAVAYDYSEEAVQLVYQGLMVFSTNSTNPVVPYIAESYNISADGLTYNFQIRNNITFSNGDPVNAYVFWYSIYRSAIMAQPPSSLISAALNTTGVTADQLNTYNSTTPPASLLTIMEIPNNAITVTGPYSLQFHLMSAYSAFLATLTQPQSSAVDPVVVSAHGGVVAGQPNSWMTVNGVGTGPWLISVTPGVETDYKKNPTYWGGTPVFESTPHLDEVVCKAVPDTLTRLEDLEHGSAQLALVDFGVTPQVVGQSGLYFPNIGGQMGVNFVGMDVWKFPLNNILIREAIAHAINETAILPIWRGFAQQYVGPIPKGVLGYNNNLQPYSYNLTLAKQLLAQAGYPNGQGLPTLVFVYATDVSPETEVSEVIQANLAAIGLKVSLRGETSGVEITTLDSMRNPADPSHPDLMWNNWAWFPDPWAFSDWFLGPLDYGASNVAWYNNTQVLNLISKADATTNQTLRAELYENASAIAYNDYPYIYLAQQKGSLEEGVPVSSINLQGFRPAPEMLGIELSDLYLIPSSG